jgi:hypothetical protein
MSRCVHETTEIEAAVEARPQIEPGDSIGSAWSWKNRNTSRLFRKPAIQKNKKKFEKY